MVSEDELQAIFAEIAARRGLDFRDYQRGPIERGVAARVAQRGLARVADYARVLRDDPAELEALVAALAIPVTRFFRAPPVFDALETRVLPELVARWPSTPLRGLCVGVATGEEAWTLAMLLTRAAERAGAPLPRVLGTDISRSSLAVAEQGEYRAAALADVPPGVAERFFQVASSGALGVTEELSARVRFAEHDVMGTERMPASSVVASFHVVLMRNLLIYFDRRLQEKALDRVAAALEPGGALVLSRIETLPAALADRCEPYPELPAGLRIYRRRP